MKRFRLAWRDGVVMEVNAASLDEAIVVCGKGQPFTSSRCPEDPNDSWFGRCIKCGKTVPRLKDKSGLLSQHCQYCLPDE